MIPRWLFDVPTAACKSRLSASYLAIYSEAPVTETPVAASSTAPARSVFSRIGQKHQLGDCDSIVQTGKVHLLGHLFRQTAVLCYARILKNGQLPWENRPHSGIVEDGSPGGVQKPFGGGLIRPVLEGGVPG